MCVRSGEVTAGPMPRCRGSPAVADRSQVDGGGVVPASGGLRERVSGVGSAREPARQHALRVLPELSEQAPGQAAVVECCTLSLPRTTVSASSFQVPVAATDGCFPLTTKWASHTAGAAGHSHRVTTTRCRRCPAPRLPPSRATTSYYNGCFRLLPPSGPASQSHRLTTTCHPTTAASLPQGPHVVSANGCHDQRGNVSQLSHER